MEINWTKSAINDLKDFKNITKITDCNKYIIDIINYVDLLKDNKHLGKIYYYTKGLIIRQLIYKEHRIFYYEKNNIIHIITVVHHKQDIKARLEYIKNIVKNNNQ